MLSLPLSPNKHIDDKLCSYKKNICFVAQIRLGTKSILKSRGSPPSTFKPPIEKNRSATPVLLALLRYLQGKKSQISVQVACGDHIVLISQTGDIN